MCRDGGLGRWDVGVGDEVVGDEVVGKCVLVLGFFGCFLERERKVRAEVFTPRVVSRWRGKAGLSLL